jgi:uncharacterized protein YjiS (DUF1127 family)
MTYLTYRDLGRRAPARVGFSPLGRFLRAAIDAVATWRSRRDSRDAFTNLRYQDDRILADIGVLRDEVEWAARLPLDVDASSALHARAEERRRQESERLARRRDARHLDTVYAREMRRIGGGR